MSLDVGKKWFEELIRSREPNAVIQWHESGQHSFLLSFDIGSGSQKIQPSVSLFDLEAIAAGDVDIQKKYVLRIDALLKGRQ